MLEITIRVPSPLREADLMDALDANIKKAGADGVLVIDSQNFEVEVLAYSEVV